MLYQHDDQCAHPSFDPDLRLPSGSMHNSKPYPCPEERYSMSQANIDKLQHVQNILARIVVEASEHHGLLAHWTLVAIYTSYLFSVYAPKILDRRQLGTPAGKIVVHKPASYCLHISQRAPPKHIPAPGQNPSKIFPTACQTPLNSWNFDFFFSFAGGGAPAPRKTTVGDLCHALSSILGGIWAL